MEKFIEKLSEKLFNEKYQNNKVFIDRIEIKKFAQNFLTIMYPQLNDKRIRTKADIVHGLKLLQLQLEGILKSVELGEGKLKISKEEVCEKIFRKFEDLEHMLNLDAKAMFEGDPAAESVDEVIITYPGFLAIAIYRLAHEFYQLKVPIFPRILSEYAHGITGIDIHPGATIGSHFFIDHGTGIVIGETTVIGEHVKIYQGVTLGALSVEKGLQNKKRHPTIEDGAVIYSNATILGGNTTIGKNSIIGGNVWLTDSVPENSLVYHKSEVKLRKSK